MNPEADWIVRNRIFMNKEEFPRPRSDESFVKSLRPGGVEPDLTTRESTRAYFNSLPWCNSPYSACGRIGHALDLHMARQRWAGRESFDDSYHYVKELVDGPYQSGTGYWGGSEADFINRTSGNMKILCTYARFVLRERVRRGATRGPQPLRPASRSGKRTRLENRVTVGTFIGE